jgi:2'-5' RNA ligase
LHLQPEINSIRKIHDKAFKKWEPHINILYPFVDSSSLTDATSFLRNCLQDEKFGKIKVNLDEVGTFTHRRNATVFLKPSAESEARLCRLRGVLVRALGCNERDGTHDGTFRPHLTMGQAGFKGIGVEKLVAAVESVLGGEWEATKLAVLKREITGEMKIVEELSLQNTEGEKSDSTSSSETTSA